jgi:uncharacterized delta-60 repeat protein
VVGTAATPDGEAVVLARYRADGSLDPTFSCDGKQTTGKRGDDVVRFDLYGTDLALLPHGRVAVVGTETTSEVCCEFTRSFVVAYRADGRLDRGFGREGRADLKFLREGNSTGWGISRQRDGRLVIAGSAYPTAPSSGASSPSGATRFAVARLLPDGGLDPTFSGNGRTTTSFPVGAAAQSVFVQRDGKVVVGGETGREFALARYMPEGALDRAFSEDGRVLSAFGDEWFSGASSIVAAPGKRIVAVGYASRDIGSERFALARYLGE